MNTRNRDKIDTRVARIGGAIVDLLEVVGEAMPEEKEALMEASKAYNDELRRIRRAAEVHA